MIILQCCSVDDLVFVVYLTIACHIMTMLCSIQCVC